MSVPNHYDDNADIFFVDQLIRYCADIASIAIGVNNNMDIGR